MTTDPLRIPIEFPDMDSAVKFVIWVAKRSDSGSGTHSRFEVEWKEIVNHLIRMASIAHGEEKRQVVEDIIGVAHSVAEEVPRLYVQWRAIQRMT